MKLIRSIIIIGCFLPKTTNAQSVQNIVPIVLCNRMYIGQDNVIAQVVPKLKDRLIFTSSSGTFIIKENDVHFNATKAGYGKIQISYINNNSDTSLIGEYSIYINKVPRLKATIGNFHTGDSISKKDIIYQQGLSVPLEFPVEGRFKITGYNLIVLRNNKSVYYRRFIGPSFSEEFKTFIRTVRQNDVLIFKDIKGIETNSDSLINLPFLYYIIK